MARTRYLSFRWSAARFLPLNGLQPAQSASGTRSQATSRRKPPSDRLGAYPEEMPVGPPDIVATIYHALGLAPQAVMHDTLLGRPMTLCDGSPILGLF